MRRWFVALLTLLLVAQFSWAAAAGYCEHEEAPQGRSAHFGHHAHSHDGHDHASGKPAAKAAAKALDMDHGHCHLVHAALASDDALGLAFEGLAAPPTERPCQAESFIPDGLDRPNWLRA